MNTLPVGLCGELSDDAARPRAERRPQLVRVDRPVGLVERHVARHRAGQDRVRAVVLVVRLEDRRPRRPGRAAPSIAAIIASVAPQVTVIWVSGSIADQPGSGAPWWRRWRRGAACAPQVMAYWLRSSWSASADSLKPFVEVDWVTGYSASQAMFLTYGLFGLGTVTVGIVSFLTLYSDIKCRGMNSV